MSPLQSAENPKSSLRLNIAFYYPPEDLMVQLWDNVVRAYDVGQVYVISDVEDVGRWSRIDTFQDIPGEKVFFSPQNAKYVPGVTAFEDFNPSEGITLCFGADEKHNEAEEFDDVVYISTPKKSPLFAVQAALIALAEINSG